MNLTTFTFVAFLALISTSACDSERGGTAGDSGLRDTTANDDLQLDLSVPTDAADRDGVEPAETGETGSGDTPLGVDSDTDISEVVCEHTADEWLLTMQEGDLAHFIDATVTSRGNIIFAGNGTTNAWVLAEIYPTGAFAMSVHPNGCLLWATLIGLEHTSVRGVAPTPDGGAVITGLSGDGDLWAARLDSNGTVAWQVAVGEDDVEEEGEVIAPNPAGGYYVLGRKGSVSDRPSIWLVQLTEDGRVVEDALTITGGYPVGFTVTDDGLFVLGRKPGNVVLLIGLDDEGSISWNRQLTLQRTGHVRKLVALPSGRFVATGGIAGEDCAAGCSDVWTATFDDSGQLLEQAVYDIGSSDSVQAVVSSTEGLALVGQTNDAGGQNVMWIGYLGDDGEADWHATIDGAGGYGTAIASLGDGSFVVAGEVHRYGHPDHRVARFSGSYRPDSSECPPVSPIEIATADGVLSVDTAPQLPDSIGTEVTAVETSFNVVQWQSPVDLVCGASD